MDVHARRSIAVDLSSEPDFRLGLAKVSPSTRQLSYARKNTTLEPRVMQLLVVLAQSQGHVVSRDALVLRCWDGVVVGDNAINRVISLLRAAAAETCDGAFEVETIKKVGYRLLVNLRDAPSDGATRDRSEFTRRAWLVSGVAGVTLAGAGGLLWLERTQPPRMARELFERGAIAQRQGLLDQTDQAISFFNEAVKVDPGYAAAWGALALSYRHKLVDDSSLDPQRTMSLIESAAKRALELDPNNADAHVARLLSSPTYGEWYERERSYRALLKRFPEHWLLRGSLGRLMFNVGRWSASVPLFKANVEHDPFLPVSYMSLGWGLWGLGRTQEAEQVLRETLGRWPKHPRIWISTFYFLALSGRPAEAIALASVADNVPDQFPPHFMERNLGWARALESGNREQVARSLAALTDLAREFPATIASSAPVVAALGDHGLALELTERYFDPTGPALRDPRFARRAGWRETDFLFTPPFTPLRSHPRWSVLVRQIGLADYWARSKTSPDPAATAQI